MTEMLQALMSTYQNNYQRTIRLETEKGYWFVAQVGEQFSSGDNFDSMTDDERIIKSIHEIVIETLNVDPATRNRKGPIVIARQIFCKITKDLGYTYTYLARYLNKDHSTLIHAYNKAEELIYIKDTMFTEKYEQVIREINDKRCI
jgi:chromosomal replication initiation ATPase DnaA